ncbi:MAG: TIGR03620 family F420-dependent LLM class oxidoreductase [Acidimicrobiales bacterium]|nr:TIGR03620 family F420-dependent LLM class oxidoreductase [Acidimicrobiales bacterium]
MSNQRTSIVEFMRERLGRVGVFSGNALGMSAADERTLVQGIEELGYGSFWCGEIIGGKEAFGHAAHLLAATESLVYGTGIANLWARHPATMQGGSTTVNDAWPGRFVLGVGVSHARIVDASSQTYDRPYSRMVGYLDDMDRQRDLERPTEVPPPPRLLAALGPKMLGLARDRADGALPYFVPPHHTSVARAELGPDRLLVVEQAFVLQTDATEARRVAREHTSGYLTRFPNYARNLQRMGYSQEDVSGGGSDRLVDDLVVWGDEVAIAARVAQLLDSGADSVVIQAVAPAAKELESLARVAPAVLDI